MKDKLVAFETRIKNLWESGELPSLVHLCGGNEEPLVRTFTEIMSFVPGPKWIFASHRNHYHALLAGISEAELEEKIKNGRSMFVYSREHNFFCSAVLAGTCGIAAGVALAIKEAGEQGSVWCFLGVGGEDIGHFYDASMFVEAHDLPCVFIIEDNGRSVDTPISIRRPNVKGLEHIYKCVSRYTYTASYPHAGSGCKFQITFKPEAIERLKPKALRPQSFMDSLEPYPNTDEFRKASLR